MTDGDSLPTPDKEGILLDWQKGQKPELPNIKPSLSKACTAPAPASIQSPNGQTISSLDVSVTQNVSTPEIVPNLNSDCRTFSTRITSRRKTIDTNSNKIVVRADEDIDEDTGHHVADHEEKNRSATLPSSITPINTFSFFFRISNFKSRVTADSPECQRVRQPSEPLQDRTGEDSGSMKTACSPNN